jgi:putative transposase
MLTMALMGIKEPYGVTEASLRRLYVVKAQADEIRRSKRELSRVTEEREILKKSGHGLRQGCKVRCAFVAKHQPQFPVRAMCRCLSVHPSGFYAWLKVPLSRRAKDDARQIDLIRKSKSKVLIHSDQESLFTGMEWAAFLKHHNMGPSMSRRGNCHDNAVAESFFSLLKRERVRRRIYRTRDEARQDVFDYIEMFYNPKRKHVRNGMQSPVEFERQHDVMTEDV